MLIKLSELSGEEKARLAHLKAWLALQLAAEAYRSDPKQRDMCPDSGVCIKFVILGTSATMRNMVKSDCTGATLKLQLLIKNGIAAMCGTELPQLILIFPESTSAIKVLFGGKGVALPVPLSPSAFKALAFFKKASSRATEMLRETQTPDCVRARLLLTATLHGLEAVSGDSYLARRMQIVPNGVVAVRVGNIEYTVEKSDRCITVVEANLHPDAILSFSDYQSAIKVLSGKRQAVVALGSGEVKITGLLPLVQGLFAVLDRLSWYLGVSV